MSSNWLAPQHSADSVAPDYPEDASADELLAEHVEAAVWHVFRNATTAQVAQVTRDVRRAAIGYAEAWQRGAPRRQVMQQPRDDSMDDLEAKINDALHPRG